MNNLLTEIQGSICLLTLNRAQKHNAFDNQLLTELHSELDNAINEPKVRVIILKANGAHFCAGADLEWMQSMVGLSKAENRADSQILANLMYCLYQSPKPTIAMVHGYAFGGGAGIIAACDIAIAAQSSQFCFSEVKLGLIPAVISPYVVKTIGEKTAQMLFMTAELFDAQRALSFNLVQHCVPETELLTFTLKYANKIIQNAPEAVILAKKLARFVVNKPIDEELIEYTADLIAQKRVSAEGQKGIKAFLNKESPNWNEH